MYLDKGNTTKFYPVSDNNIEIPISVKKLYK